MNNLPRKQVWVRILSYTIYKSNICTILCTTAVGLNLEVLCAFCLPEPSADTLENSLNPDQTRQIIEPNHGPNSLILFLKELFFLKMDVLRKSTDAKKHENYQDRY